MLSSLDVGDAYLAIVCHAAIVSETDFTDGSFPPLRYHLFLRVKYLKYIVYILSYCRYIHSVDICTVPGDSHDVSWEFSNILLLNII